MQRKNDEIKRGLKAILYTTQIELEGLVEEAESFEEQLESAVECGDKTDIDYYQRHLDYTQAKGEQIELALQWLRDKGVF